MSNPEVPEQTKRILRRFLIQYDVSDARKTIFMNKVRPLLVEFDPIESALNDRDRINELFARLRRHYSPATYATFVGVIRRFLSWLGDGTPPASMRDVKQGTSGNKKRNLEPEDMLTWEDGLLISDVLCNIQLQAAVQSQLDCGFRPSEFIDLTYGDVEVNTGLAVFHVRGGKTGSRNVVAHRCVPSLLKWLDAHPTKRPGDPLWVSEGSIKESANGRLSIKPYSYPAIAKRIRVAGRKGGIGKPLDFYNLRHSSCVLDKLDNLPMDLAAERHGHSVKHFVGTYGRLSVQDVMRRFHSHYGTGEEEEVQLIEHRTCPACQRPNDQAKDWCSSCGTPLNASGARESAVKNTLSASMSITPTQDELTQVKAELAAAREREEVFRKEQLFLLQQMREIRTALVSNQSLTLPPVR
jgi:integrase